MLRDTGVPPSRLLLEITEGALLHGLDGPVDLMTRLRRFVPEEKEALERWSENCRIRGVVEAPPAAAPKETDLERY